MKPRTIATGLNLPAINHGHGFIDRTLSPQQGLNVDPFLVMTDFRMSRAYFPPHPHAGFAVMTYVFPDSPGAIINRDSQGDRSRIDAGGLHWTQAARGVVHEEIPETEGLETHGLQLWVNLRAEHKLTDPVAYHVAGANVPIYAPTPEVQVRVVVGETNGIRAGFVPLTPITLLDVRLEPGATFTHPLPDSHTALLFTQKGSGQVAKQPFGSGQIVLFNPDGDNIHITAGPDGLETLLLAGEPLREPVVYGGPFVGSSEDQIRQARLRFGRGEMGQLTPSPVFG
jgi:redox-sensitive bicupin YhaK (pirin superfamily)